jgi:hypothetical protein
MRARTLSTLVVALSMPAVAGAQSGAGAVPPEQLASAFFQAVAAGRWAEAVGYLDVAPVERHRQEMVAEGRRRDALSEPSVEALLRHDPEMPRAAAEYQVRKVREAMAKHGNGVARTFARVPDVEALAALPLDTAAARWLEAQDFRYQLRRQLAAQGCSPALADSIDARPPHRIVGTVVRDTVAYVLHQDPDWPEAGLAFGSMTPQVMPLRRGPDGRWRIVARYDLLQRANGVFVQSECSRAGGERPPT